MGGGLKIRRGSPLVGVQLPLPAPAKNQMLNILCSFSAESRRSLSAVSVLVVPKFVPTRGCFAANTRIIASACGLTYRFVVVRLEQSGNLCGRDVGSPECHRH